MAAALGRHGTAQLRPDSLGEIPSGLCPNVNLDQGLTFYMTLNQYTSFFLSIFKSEHVKFALHYYGSFKLLVSSSFPVQETN